MRSSLGSKLLLLPALLATLSINAVAAPAAPSGPSTGAAKKWTATIPPVADNTETWQQLITALLANNMDYGALAAARTMLNFFGDLPTKELAFKTIVQLIDEGYPFTTRPYFVPGDIEPTAGSEFAKNYFFYKGVVNLDQKMQHWAENHFAKIDRNGFPKYIFFQALTAYGDGKIDEAILLTKKALSLTTGPTAANLASKEARTLARFYYEKGEFQQAFEIYSTFLLKTNPIDPGDWLEAAWSLYGLKKYPEALGYLYNLESKSVGPTLLLEKYILRALIYRESCSVASVNKLNSDFKAEFGKTIDAIRLGEPLSPIPQLVNLEHPETVEYRQAIQSIARLKVEQKRIESLPENLRPLATYLYSSEIKMIERKRRMKENDALQVLARHLVILSESLRFLAFDVIREQYNPDVVFADKDPAVPLVEDGDGLSFRLRWKHQNGDFWRDERQSYLGEVKNQCEH